MLTEVKKHIKLIFISFKYNLLKELQYRTAFISSIIGMILNDAFFIIQWIIIFSISDNIGGYGLREILILWGVAAGSYGVSHLFFYNANNIGEYIIHGKLDTYLVQPKNVLINVISSGLSAPAIGDILYGYIILIFIGVNPLIYILFTSLIILGGIIQTAFYIIIQSLTFWLSNASIISESLSMALLMPSTYPESIFKGFIRILLYTALPLGFIIFIPTNIMINFNLMSLIIVLMFAIFISVLSFIIFNLGLKKYSSSNLMMARI
jgi:ABC-2 type transport system permease protein